MLQNRRLSLAIGGALLTVLWLLGLGCTQVSLLREDSMGIPEFYNVTWIPWLVLGLAEDLERPLVLDADGINALAGHMDVLDARRDAVTVLTPHDGEFTRIGGDLTGTVDGDVTAPIGGALSGRVGGDVGTVHTKNRKILRGNLTGEVGGSVLGKVMGDVSGRVAGDITTVYGNILPGAHIGGCVGTLYGKNEGTVLGGVQRQR